MDCTPENRNFFKIRGPSNCSFVKIFLIINYIKKNSHIMFSQTLSMRFDDNFVLSKFVHIEQAIFVFVFCLGRLF